MQRPHVILNVDDNEVVRYARSRILRHVGYEVIEAVGSADALCRIRMDRPALVLLDVKLSDVGGFELCRRIKVDPECADTLVLCISAELLSSKDRVAGLDAGADGYLFVPHEPEELVASVRALLRLHETQSALRESEKRLAADLAAVQRLQEASTLLLQEGNVDALHRKILDAAVVVMRSDMASMQILHQDRGALRLLAWRGLHPASAAFWEWVRIDSGSACAEALRTGQRVVVPDIETCDFIAGSPDLDAYRQAGIRAQQSTPLISRDGRLLGMVSTHWCEPHTPSDRDLRLLDVLARQAADLIERAQTEAALRASEERFRDIAESASDWFWETDTAHRFTFCSERLGELAGLRPEDVRGKRRDELLIETDSASDLDAYLADLAAHRPFRNFTYWTEAPIGRRCLSVSGKPVFDAAGTFRGYRGTGTDITAHKRVEIALRESEASMRLALAAANASHWSWARETDALTLPRRTRRRLGLLPEEPVTWTDFVARFVHPDDQERVLGEFRAAASGAARFESEYRLVLPDGAARWYAVRGRRLEGALDVPDGASGVMLDITDRKRAEEQREFLIQELNHRVKNALATVLSLATLARRRSESLDAFAATFEGRLRALAGAYGLLARGEWSRTELHDLLQLSLAPYQRSDGSNLDLQGLDIALPAPTALTLHMIFHELTTNAAKYGALSVPGGRAEVRWDVERSEAGRLLRLRWQEAGGPAVVPPSRRGMGTSLIERSVAYELDGEAELEFRPEGLRCTLTIPLPEDGQARPN